MRSFRIYRLDPGDHIHAPVSVIACRDDGAALEKAEQMLAESTLEVWDGDRLIARLPPSRRQQGCAAGE